jgi:hypothetical protein
MTKRKKCERAYSHSALKLVPDNVWIGAAATSTTSRMAPPG